MKPLNKTPLLRGNINIFLISLGALYFSLDCPKFFGVMLFCIMFFLLIDFLPLLFITNLLMGSYIVLHLVFLILKFLVVSALHPLLNKINISLILGHVSVFFLVLNKVQKGLCCYGYSN